MVAAVTVAAISGTTEKQRWYTCPVRMEGRMLSSRTNDDSEVRVGHTDESNHDKTVQCSSKPRRGVSICIYAKSWRKQLDALEPV